MNNTNTEEQYNIFTPKELEYKSRREQAYKEARNAEAPLAPRTKAWFNVIGEGAKEMMEGAKRDFSNNNSKNEENVQPAQEDTKNLQRDEIYDNEANRNEHQYREKRHQLWHEASNSDMTLTTRTKAGACAIVAGAHELFEGGKKEFEQKKQKRNKKTQGSENLDSEKNSSVVLDHEHMKDETDQEQKSLNIKQNPEYADCSSIEEEKNSINLDKDEVMSDFQKCKEADLLQKRRIQSSFARDSTLPLSERIKAGGSAFVTATKELSEGARREFREKNTKA